jgi:SSS family solute:Na+ symporter
VPGGAAILGILAADPGGAEIHGIPIAIICVYVAVLFGVTWWARRLTARGGGGMVGYLLAGRGLPSWVAAALLAGLAVGGVSTIGVAQWAYGKGFSAGWYNAAWAGGALVLGLVAARRFRRMEITTLPELFERHYTTTARVLGVIGQLVIQVVITSLQYVAGGAILHSLMPGAFSFQVGMLITAAVFVGITLIGGFWAAGLTNVINVIVIYLGIILGAAMTVGRLGGLGALTRQLPEGHPGFDLLAMGPWLIVGWFLVMLTTVHGTQSVIQVSFAARDGRTAARAYLLGALCILPAGFVSALIGMSAAVLYPAAQAAIDAKEALPLAVLDLSPAIAGIILSGLWAADVSTASALLMGSATLVCGDIIKRFFVPELSREREQLVCRLTVAGLSVITFLLALTVTGILKMLVTGLALTSGYAVIVLMTMYAPGLCRRSSATWTLAVTMVTFAAWLAVRQLEPGLPDAIFFTLPASLLTFLAVAVFAPRR